MSVCVEFEVVAGSESSGGNVRNQEMCFMLYMVSVFVLGLPRGQVRLMLPRCEDVAGRRSC